MRFSVAIVAFWLVGPTSALAQSENWLVLPITDGEDTGWMDPVIREVGGELRKQGVGVWSTGQAVVTFERRGSSPPSSLTPSMLSGWEERSQTALRLLAQGESAEARALLEGVQGQSLAWLDALNRDPAQARRVLDTCLYLVRALLETGDEQGALSQARDCAGMVPQTEPTPLMHPPAVAERFAEAARPLPSRVGTLLAESEPSGCQVRINGVLVGRTPFELGDLYPGSYRAQVECEPGARGRVHPVRVSRGRSALFIVDRFDRALRTDPFLHLKYAKPSTEPERARDAREVARALPASAVVLAHAPVDEELELRLISGPLEDSAFARITTTSSGPERALVADAVATLLEGECRDLRGGTAVLLDCATGAPVPSTEAESEGTKNVRPPRGQFIAGLTLASTGTASLLAGYGLLIARANAGNDWISDPGSLDAHGKWLNLGTGLWVTGSAGAAMLVGAMPLALPYRQKPPWWAWLSGGLGIGLAASAIAVGVTAHPNPAETCSVNNLNPDPCVSRAKGVDLAVMLGVTAAPLVTMPLVYLFRKDDKKPSGALTAGVRVGSSSGLLSIRGAF